MLVSLRMEAVYAKEQFNVRWVCEAGLVENIDLVVDEYKHTRGLLVRDAPTPHSHIFIYS